MYIHLYVYVYNSQEFRFSNNKNSFEKSQRHRFGKAFLWEAETEAKELQRPQTGRFPSPRKVLQMTLGKTRIRV